MAGRHRRVVRGVVVACVLLAGVGAGVAVAGPGGLDPSFGTSGVTVLERPTSTFPSPTSLTVGGKIVTVTSSGGKVYVSRLTPDGAPDPTFDGGGKAVIESGVYLGAYGLAVQSDGKIVVVGYANKAESSPAMVWRLKANGGSGAPNGALDPTFNGTGVAELSSATFNLASAVVIQPDGKIVVAVNALTSPGPYQVAVWRLREDGTPDPTFDTDGVAGISDKSEDRVNAIALQKDGKIVIAGSSALATSPTDAAVWRLNANGGPGPLNGALDTTFDVDGQANIDSGGSEVARAVAVQPDGKIVIAGSTSGGPLGSDAMVWRLGADGGLSNMTNDALDPTFDTHGAAAIGGPGVVATAEALQLQPDGKILIAGSGKVGASPYTADVWRLAANGGSGAVDGALDPTFGTGGLTAVAQGSGATASGLVLAPDRRILAAGSTFSGNLLVFRALGDPFSLTVSNSGTGSGVVRSSPAGVECGGACSSSFDDGAEVILTATSAAGSEFAGFSGGGCTGAGACALTMSADRAVTATFNAQPSPSPHPPALADARQSHQSWREGGKLASFSRSSRKRAPVGTTFSFTLDQPASTRFVFTQGVRGRSVHGKCRAPTQKNRHARSCLRSVTRGTLAFAGHTGVNKLTFQGPVTPSKKLPLGRYTLIIIATNASGQRSSASTLRFTIVR